VKKIIILSGLVLLFIASLLFFNLSFYDSEKLINRKVEDHKQEHQNLLPIIDKDNIYNISKIKDIPVNSIVVTTVQIKEITDKGNRYEGILKDSIGEIKFSIDKRKIPEEYQTLFRDAVFLDMEMKLLVKKKDDHVEILEIW